MPVQLRVLGPRFGTFAQAIDPVWDAVQELSASFPSVVPFLETSPGASGPIPPDSATIAIFHDQAGGERNYPGVLPRGLSKFVCELVVRLDSETGDYRMYEGRLHAPGDHPEWIGDGIGSSPSLEQLLHDFLDGVVGALGPAIDVETITWQRRAEELAGHVTALTDDRQRLQGALTKALGDVDIANERIDQLIAINRALILELNTKSGAPRKRFLSFLAASVAAILTPIPSVYFAHQLEEHRDKAVDAAQFVVTACSSGNIIVFEEEPSPEAQPAP